MTQFPARTRQPETQADKARALLVVDASIVVMRGLAATRTELDSLHARVRATEQQAGDDAGLALVRAAALACIIADPLTDDLLAALDAACDAVKNRARVKAVQPPREPRAVRHHSWMDRGDLV